MDLKEAFPRPTPGQTETALRKVMSVARAPSGIWAAQAWKVAAVVAGMGVAYAAGFARGSRGVAERSPNPDTVAKAGDMTIRPPVLIAQPRS